MELETLNRLYLELSQVVTAKSSKELVLEDALKQANEVCRSMWEIAKRRGEATNWEGFIKQLDKVLLNQHRLMYPERHKNLGLKPTSTFP